MQQYEGKAKRVTVRDDGDVEIYYKDDATAFNGQKHELFAGKGALNSQIAERLLVYLQQRGTPTHHVQRLDDRTLLAKRVKIFPLEVVVRFKVAGSLAKRTGLPDNTVCAPPIVETYYKRDDLGDPIVNDDHIRLLGIATPADVLTLRRMALKAALDLKALCDKAEIDLVDLKLEFGQSGAGILLADEVSPDTCRFRDKKTGSSLDKDVFRQGKGDLLSGYREVLQRFEKALAEVVRA
ncbi:MAG: phosphoribosylaminoimidazolesuccinocarboxamide synthase [Deltaproteobacteria bacterium]|nr:phosphoribosylaminoimidazolesuccinocarboxamide synthase [Deltaproteobacteria bacterium]